MTNTKFQNKKLIWQVPAFILLLISMGNLIMLFTLKGDNLTGQMFLYGSINSVVVGGSFALGLFYMVK
ncbi:MAG: hypothetical protein Q7W54_03650, partial [Bacteroidota bacterium]|nr:hypothetical protein [Bacteroidota bacterium]